MGEPRIDLIERAAGSSCSNVFDWLDDEVQLQVQRNPANRGYSPIEIKELAKDWIRKGGKVVAKVEDRDPWCERREYWYHIVIKGLPDFPAGLFVEMELSIPDETEPVVTLLGAHPSGA